MRGSKVSLWNVVEYSLQLMNSFLRSVAVSCFYFAIKKNDSFAPRFERGTVEKYVAQWMCDSDATDEAPALSIIVQKAQI